MKFENCLYIFAFLMLAVISLPDSKTKKMQPSSAILLHYDIDMNVHDAHAPYVSGDYAA